MGDGAERPGVGDRPAEEPRATARVEERDARRTSEETAAEAGGGGIPDNPAATVIALIEAFERGDRERAAELYPARRWGSDEGFVEMAEYYRGSELDLRPVSIQIWDRDGATRVAVNGTGREGNEMIYVFFLYEEDGDYKVDAVEGRPAGAP